MTAILPCPHCGTRMVCADGITFDSSVNVMWIDGKGIRLSPTEFILMRIFNRASPAMVSTEAINEQMGWRSQTRNVGVYVHHLRNRLADTPYYIATVPRLGYRLKRQEVRAA